MLKNVMKMIGKVSSAPLSHRFSSNDLEQHRLSNRSNFIGSKVLNFVQDTRFGYATQHAPHGTRSPPHSALETTFFQEVSS